MKYLALPVTRDAFYSSVITAHFPDITLKMAGVF